MLRGHIYMFIATLMWGMMAPIGKDAMLHGISGLDMVGIRACGGALLFWLASAVTPHSEEHTVRLGRKELLWLFGASLFAMVFNQCGFIIGLSITSPLNASIMTTIMPIITMGLAVLILKERVTRRKLCGLMLGCMGALTLITASAGGRREGGVLLGDLLCIGGQFSYAFYLTAFKDVISRHSAITCQKWMMLFAAIVVMPFALPSLMKVDWAGLSPVTYAETAFVVVGGTFMSFLCCTKAQQILRPTVVAMYNYVQPIVACTLSVIMGLGIFGYSHLIAVALVFTGVYLVNHDKLAN